MGVSCDYIFKIVVVEAGASTSVVLVVEAGASTSFGKSKEL